MEFFTGVSSSSGPSRRRRETNDDPSVVDDVLENVAELGDGLNGIRAISEVIPPVGMSWMFIYSRKSSHDSRLVTFGRVLRFTINLDSLHCSVKCITAMKIKLNKLN